MFLHFVFSFPFLPFLIGALFFFAGTLQITAVWVREKGRGVVRWLHNLHPHSIRGIKCRSLLGVWNHCDTCQTYLFLSECCSHEWSDSKKALNGVRLCVVCLLPSPPSLRPRYLCPPPTSRTGWLGRNNSSARTVAGTARPDQQNR